MSPPGSPTPRNQTAALAAALLLAGLQPALMASEPEAGAPAGAGKLRLDESFATAPPPGSGDLSHFARGYQGWRYNVEDIGGLWRVRNGAFCGREIPAHQHPATASYGFDHSDIILACGFRLDDITDPALPWHTFMIRFTNRDGYVASLSVHSEGFEITRSARRDEGGYDHTSMGKVVMPIPKGSWHDVVVEISGPRFMVTVNGRTVHGEHPSIAGPKTSVLFGAQTAASIRQLKIWDAAPAPAPAVPKTDPADKAD